MDTSTILSMVVSLGLGWLARHMGVMAPKPTRVPLAMSLDKNALDTFWQFALGKLEEVLQEAIREAVAEAVKQLQGPKV